ncbi:putative colanic acid biosynthesis glycosyl transferase wcaC domain protein [Escherichia coli DEC12C]|nr:putative colanic acid biosynthesis glycosyl transferase wcaC domain protein [Escherichia coli DEC12C]
MKILQFNVRLAEGGAAGVALDLHLRALEKGLSSRFVYGYGKGGKKAPVMRNIHRLSNIRRA